MFRKSYMCANVSSAQSLDLYGLAFSKPLQHISPLRIKNEGTYKFLQNAVSVFSRLLRCSVLTNVWLGNYHWSENIDKHIAIFMPVKMFARRTSLSVLLLVYDGKIFKFFIIMIQNQRMVTCEILVMIFIFDDFGGQAQTVWKRFQITLKDTKSATSCCSITLKILRQHCFTSSRFEGTADVEVVK